jgi:hypothetical protein
VSELDDAERQAALAIEEVSRVLTQAGLSYVDPPPFTMGKGVAVGWSEDHYAMLSVGMFAEQQLNITYGVLRNIDQNREAALEYCNLHNQSVAAYPVYLHDAANGWDILQQNVLPMQVLRDAPQFVIGYYLSGSSEVVDSLRTAAVERGLGGQPYRWGEEDVGRLLAKSLF